MKINSYLKNVLALSASAAIIAGISACSKKEGESEAPTQTSQASDPSPVRHHGLLSYLPQSTLGFYIFDYSLASAKKFIGTPWSGKDFSLTDSIKKLAEGELNDSKGILVLSELEQEGLIPAPKSAGKLEQVIASFSVEKDASGAPLPAAVLYESFAKGQDVAPIVLAIKAKLEAKGLKTSPVSVDGGQGFTVDLVMQPPATKSEDEDDDAGGKKAKKSAEKPVTVSLAVAAKGERLMLTSNQGLVNSEFLSGQPSKNTRFAEMENDAEFKRALASVPSSESEFSFGYFDIQKMLTMAAALSPEAKDAQDVLNKVPLRAAVISRDMTTSLTDRGAITFISDPQHSLGGLDELAQNSPTSFASQLPGQLVGFLSLDGALIRGIGKSILDNTPQEKKAEAQMVYDQVKSVAEIGLAVRPQQGASPMPELALLVNSPDAKAMIANASAMISAGAGSQGFLPPFQKKEVQGASVEYALSPFGAGVYLCASGDQAIVSTSEGILSEILKNQKDNKSSALDGLSADSKSLLSSGNSLALMHVDYSRVASLIEGLSASLGIFTGGQPLVENSVLESLKKYGQSSASFVFSNRALQIVSRTEPVVQ